MFINEKSLIEEAREAKVLPNAFIVFLWAIVILILGQVIGSGAEVIIAKFIGDNPEIAMLNKLVTNFMFISLLIFARVKFREKRDIAGIGFRKKGFLKKYLIGFFIGVIMFSCVTLLLKLTGHIELNTNPTTPIGMAALNGVLIIIPGWMIQSATEEIVVRGWLMNVIGARYNKFLAVFASSMFFGIIHSFNPNVSILPIVNLFLTGWLYGMYVMKTNDLWGVCGIHAAWNWVQGNIFGFEVSGQGIPIGSIMQLKLTGTEWITGGSFGPEAGVISTIIIIIFIMIVYFMPTNKRIV